MKKFVQWDKKMLRNISFPLCDEAEVRHIIMYLW